MAIEITPIDPDDVPSDTAPNADGTPRKRRTRSDAGQPRTPGTRRSSAKSKADVETAVATMGSLYSAASAALLMTGRRGTAEQFSIRIEQTQKANREAFESSPSLASAVAKLGQVSSIGLFIGANISLLATTMLMFRMETAQLRAEAAKSAPEPETGDYQ